jgi:hypothetical protein
MSELKKEIIQALQNASDGHDYFAINEESGLLNIDAQLNLETLEKEFIRVIKAKLLSDEVVEAGAVEIVQTIKNKIYTERAKLAAIYNAKLKDSITQFDDLHQREQDLYLSYSKKALTAAIAKLEGE